MLHKWDVKGLLRDLHSVQAQLVPTLKHVEDSASREVLLIADLKGKPGGPPPSKHGCISWIGKEVFYFHHLRHLAGRRRPVKRARRNVGYAAVALFL